MYKEVSIVREEGRWTIKYKIHQQTLSTAFAMLEDVVNSWEFRQELLAVTMSPYTKNTVIYKTLMLEGGYFAVIDLSFDDSFINKFNYTKIAVSVVTEWLANMNLGRERDFLTRETIKIVKNLMKHQISGGLLHDVSTVDKEIDVLLGSSLPTKAININLVCERSVKNLFRKECRYL